MSKDIRIRKGVDIKLKGTAEKIYANTPQSETFAVKPTDFVGVMPKLIAREGDEVKAGSPLFYSKDNDKVKFPSPVSGEVVEIVRGEKRKILEIKILADKEIKYEDFGTADPSALSREGVIEKLLNSGTWSYIRQRPYGTIANPEAKPKSIFISAFNSAPMAADNDFALHGMEKEFQTGLDAVAKLTEGKVHLNIDGKSNPSTVFTNAKNVQINKVSGPHPAGNVGIQIHHIDPIKKGETVWYLYPQDVVTIGRLFLEGKYDASRIVALTGSEVLKPKYYKMLSGASIKGLVENNVTDGNNRFISGDVFTGTKIAQDGYLGFYDTQIAVLPEGDEPEFMGWLAPGFGKFSISRTFTWFLNKNKEMALNTNAHGEERAFVVSGEYESVLPMDIYPVHLLKSIMTGDVEAMERLGIYEVIEEDMALCEVVCTSKIDVQDILRDGLTLAQKELG